MERMDYNEEQFRGIFRRNLLFFQEKKKKKERRKIHNKIESKSSFHFARAFSLSPTICKIILRHRSKTNQRGKFIVKKKK